jgi:hypothetical protein
MTPAVIGLGGAMWLLLLPLKLRYMLLSTALVGFFAATALTWRYPDRAALLAIPLIFFTFFSGLGLRDFFQSRHAILRNYPITAHLRFLFEKIRPEMRQYFFEDDKNGLPFPRDKRAIVYQRAKGALDKRPFGTEYDVYQSHYEWLHHSVAPKEPSPDLFRIAIGGPHCTQPYSASVFNISAMSYGALSANAVRALNKGARMGGFAHDTGEGGFSPYHQEHGGDIIWEVGSGYFSCRNADGSFAPAKFAEAAANPQIKMVELKLSQGAKPGHGGVLPAAKVTREIARASAVSHAVRIASLQRATRRFRRLWSWCSSSLKCGTCRGASRRVSSFASVILGSLWPSSRPCWRPGLRRISLLSTAPKAAREPRHSSLWTIWGCRCGIALPSCMRHSSAQIFVTGSKSALPERSHPVSTWPASWRLAPTGVTRHAASCSRSAVFRLSSVTRAVVQPA